MLVLAQRVSLFVSLYAVTLSILLSENVVPDRAAVLGLVGASAKTMVVFLHHWLWRCIHSAMSIPASSSSYIDAATHHTQSEGENDE